MESHERTEQRLRSLAYDAYDAMLAWMGPGRDPAFLDMHLLCTGKLPEIWSHAEAYEDRRIRPWRLPSMGPTQGHRTLLHPRPFPLVSGMISRMDHEWPTDEQKAEIRSLLRDAHGAGLGGLWRAAELGPACLPMQSVWGNRFGPSERRLYLTVLWAPGPTFRTDLLAEKARPWSPTSVFPRAFFRPPALVRRTYASSPHPALVQAL